MKLLISVIPMFLGFIIDSLIGDPYTMPHPIRLIGRFISFMEKRIRVKFVGNLGRGGVLLCISVILLSTMIPFFILAFAYRISVICGIIIESIFCFYLIAPKCLKDESMKVYRKIAENDVEGARKAVSMIVGRDTAVLDEKGIIRAAVETVAENTSDGVTAPLMYISLGGAVLGFMYKAANTLDSMVGYKNEKYADIGRFSAKYDDFLNYIPSRISALAMILSAGILGLDMKNAYRIWKRDRRKHASPNSAQTESVCAGALGVQLAGDAYYFGELHKKEHIGDNLREIENQDIVTVNRLMYVTSMIILLFGMIFRALLWGVIFR